VTAIGGDTHQERLAALMVAYQGGDMDALAELYELMRPQLRGFLRGLAWDAATADDLVQETFLQVHRARHTHQPGRPVRPWLYGIARNVFLMHRRSAARRLRHEQPAAEELPELPVPPEAERLADRGTLWRALAQLGEGRREAVMLHHLLGMDFKEVGAVLGIASGAAKVRAHRGVAELRRILGVGEVGSWAG
jgi:RNA polymerase sigma-70 factor (ECF subfamily)